ncbi:MAG TPA: hypothetical protein VFW62_01570 [bacterium]|nr:hypothetical protein [bacterium]
MDAITSFVGFFLVFVGPWTLLGLAAALVCSLFAWAFDGISHASSPKPPIPANPLDNPPQYRP